MEALTTSTVPDNFNVIVHVEDEYSYRFICKARYRELLHSIKSCYLNLKKHHLVIYGIQGNIEHYITPKKSKWIDWRGAKGILPSDENRLDDDEFYDISDEDEETKTNF